MDKKHWERIVGALALVCLAATSGSSCSSPPERLERADYELRCSVNTDCVAVDLCPCCEEGECGGFDGAIPRASLPDYNADRQAISCLAPRTVKQSTSCLASAPACVDQKCEMLDDFDASIVPSDPPPELDISCSSSSECTVLRIGCNLACPEQADGVANRDGVRGGTLGCLSFTRDEAACAEEDSEAVCISGSCTLVEVASERPSGTDCEAITDPVECVANRCHLLEPRTISLDDEGQCAYGPALMFCVGDVENRAYTDEDPPDYLKDGVAIYLPAAAPQGWGPCDAAEPVCSCR